jgi:hypothetical protein
MATELGTASSEVNPQVHYRSHNVTGADAIKGRPLTAKGRATRRRIVDTAADLMVERGVSAVSLDEVGRVTSTSKSLIAEPQRPVRRIAAALRWHRPSIFDRAETLGSNREREVPNKFTVNDSPLTAPTFKPIDITARVFRVQCGIVARYLPIERELVCFG